MTKHDIVLMRCFNMKAIENLATEESDRRQLSVL
jgi:hypothetical protein